MGKKLLGVATIIGLIVLAYNAFGILLAMSSTSIGLLVIGVIFIVICFLWYKFLRWCFTS